MQLNYIFAIYYTRCIATTISGFTDDLMNCLTSSSNLKPFHNVIPQVVIGIQTWNRG